MLISIPNAFNIAQLAVDGLKNSGDVVLSSLIGAPNGIAGLDSNGDIVATAVHRRDTAANIALVVLKAGEIAVTSDTRDILVGDGSTTGGLLLQGGVRTYNMGPVELLSTTTDPAHTSTIPMVSGLYRIWGVIGFSGDSDNQSNLSFSCGTTAANLDTSMQSQIGSAGGTFKWRLSKSTFFEAPTILDWWPITSASFGSFTHTPPTTTVSTGRCEFDLWMQVSTAGVYNRPFSMRLRTAKLATPTIMAAYRLMVQRMA